MHGGVCIGDGLERSQLKTLTTATATLGSHLPNTLRREPEQFQACECNRTDWHRPNRRKGLLHRMNKNFVFLGRHKEVQQLRALYELRRHVLIVGAAGLGKTALLQRVRKLSRILICDESSSLRRICESLERQLGCSRRKLSVIERKNRLLIAAYGAIHGVSRRQDSDLDRMSLGSAV